MVGKSLIQIPNQKDWNVKVKLPNNKILSGDSKGITQETLEFLEEYDYDYEVLSHIESDRTLVIEIIPIPGSA